MRGIERKSQAGSGRAEGRGNLLLLDLLLQLQVR